MTVLSIVGGSQANASASGGKVTGATVSNAVAAVVIAANPQRRKLVFHNPGTNDIYVAPSVNASNVAIVLTAGVAGSFLVVGNGGTWTFDGGEIQGAWQAIAMTAPSPLTIMDSNI